MFVTVQHPQRGEFTMPGWPVKMSGSTVPVRAAPLLGQDNLEVYGRLLDLEPQELELLHEEGVI
jgi:formyl-CoA transferase